MTKINFLYKNDLIVGFISEGHADTAETGSDILCAGISSALYLVSNTLTEVYNFNPEIKVDDGFFTLKLSDASALDCQNILKGLLLHLKALQNDYPQNMKISSKILNS